MDSISDRKIEQNDLKKQWLMNVEQNDITQKCVNFFTDAAKYDKFMYREVINNIVAVVPIVRRWLSLKIRNL